MLRNEIKENSLFTQVQDLIAPMGYKVVDVQKRETPGGVELYLTVFLADRDVTTDDLAEVYNIVYPRYQVIFGRRDLTLEVSSPGMQRNFKDVYEFTLFKGKLVKVYSSAYSSNIEGTINDADDNGVTLTSAVVQDTGEGFETLSLSYDEIQKAKLTYRWEEKK